MVIAKCPLTGSIKNEFHSAYMVSMGREALLRGKHVLSAVFSTTFTLLFSLPFTPVGVKLSKAIACNVGLLHREQDSAPLSPSPMGVKNIREHTCACPLHSLPGDFENKISYLPVFIPVLYNH